MLLNLFVYRFGSVQFCVDFFGGEIWLIYLWQCDIKVFYYNCYCLSDFSCLLIFVLYSWWLLHLLHIYLQLLFLPLKVFL